MEERERKEVSHGRIDDVAVVVVVVVVESIGVVVVVRVCGTCLSVGVPTRFQARGPHNDIFCG